MVVRPALVVCALLLTPALAAQQPGTAPPSDEELSIQLLVQAIETAISTTDRAAWLNLQSPNADRDAATEFYDSMVAQGVTRAVVRERDRAPLLGSLPGEGYSLLADVFIETGARGRLATWSVDIRRPRASTERQPWRMVGQEKVSSVEGLHRLSLHPEKQFTARDLLIRSVDFELRLPAGEVFVAETAEGVTGMVLIGDGQMTFAPTPSEERGQVRLFAGTETLEQPFSAAFVRLNPFEFDQQIKRQTLTPATLDARAFRRAQGIFDEDVVKSFSLDLSEFSRDAWSLLPQIGDFLAEVRTRRFDTITYVRATGEAEDVTLFHRDRKRNIAAYASEMKLSSRGRFFNEDDLVEYDVLDYNVDATFHPEREWIDGRADVRLRVKSYALAALTMKLAEDFSVRSVTSRQLGRLLFLKVRNQNSFVINLPSPVSRDTELTISVVYSGRIQRQSMEQESIQVQEGGGRQRAGADDMPYIPPEPKWLLSNRSHWYPQGQVSDYATATIRFTVPGDYTAVSTGILAAGSPTVAGAAVPGQLPRAQYTYVAQQPVRYLSVVVSKMNHVESATVALDIPPRSPRAANTMTIGPIGTPVPGIGSRSQVRLTIEANRRQEARGRAMVETAADILRLYASVVGDVPYDGMTVAMVEDHLPGGHSPGYFVVLNNPLPVTPFVWRNDPAAFNNFPEFFIAHEIAHQWWGQAVGWKNYHEQWLSEGFAQYFAALYAKDRRGEPAFREVLRQFRRWALDQSDQGAVYLGYRLGHIKSDSRVFRALVYNKGAGVLHMLRRVIGDEAFFRGIRRFYSENRFRKAGTEDLQRAMEAESGATLERFFQRWIYESGVPRVRYSTSVDGQEMILRLEQVPGNADGPVYDLPVTVTLNYADKPIEEVVVMKEAVLEKRFPIGSGLRSIEVNLDGASLAHFERYGR